MYFEDLEDPAHRSRFDIEWGDFYGIPDGWRPRGREEVRKRIEELAENIFNGMEINERNSRK